MTSQPPPEIKGPSRLLGDYRFWLVVAMAAVGILLHLGSESRGPGPQIAAIPILGNHDFHRLLYLAPIVYGAYIFGAGAGLVLSILTALVFAPHAISEAQAGGWEHAFFEIAGTAGVGGLTGWLVASLVSRKHRLERTLNELSQSERELQSQVQTVEADKRWHAALYTIAEACSQAQGLPALLAGALGALLEVLHLDHRAGVFLVDEERGALYLAAHRGLSPEFVAAEARVSLGECLCGLVAQTGESTFSADSAADPRHSRMALAQPHAHIIVPLKSGGRVVGVAFFYPEASYRLSPTDFQLLSAAGAQVGLAIERISLQEKERRQGQQAEVERQRLAALHSILEAATSTLEIDDLLPRVLETAVQRLGYHGGSMWLLDPETGAPGPRAHYQLAQEFITDAWKLSQQRGPQGPHLTAEGITLRYSDDQDSPFLALARKEGLVTLLIIPLFADGRRIGSLQLGNRHHLTFQPGEMELLEAVGAQLGLALERARLHHQTVLERQRADALAEASRQAEEQLENAYLEITRSLIATLEAKDYYTGGHSARVRQYSRQMAVEMGLPAEEVDTISLAAELHDLGKIGVPDHILLKPGPLEPAEWAEIKRHPERSVEILRHLGFLGQVLPIIRAHHERVDGQGYPDNLPNGAIPLGARILAVADAYDALTSERPYRPAFSHQRSLAILQENAGRQWDPQVVAAFIASLEKAGPAARLEKAPSPRRRRS